MNNSPSRRYVWVCTNRHAVLTATGGAISCAFQGSAHVRWSAHTQLGGMRACAQRYSMECTQCGPLRWVLRMSMLPCAALCSVEWGLVAPSVKSFCGGFLATNVCILRSRREVGTCGSLPTATHSCKLCMKDCLERCRLHEWILLLLPTNGSDWPCCTGVGQVGLVANTH